MHDKFRHRVARINDDRRTSIRNKLNDATVELEALEAKLVETGLYKTCPVTREFLIAMVALRHELRHWHQTSGTAPDAIDLLKRVEAIMQNIVANLSPATEE